MLRPHRTGSVGLIIQYSLAWPPEWARADTSALFSNIVESKIVFDRRIRHQSTHPNHEMSGIPQTPACSPIGPVALIS